MASAIEASMPHAGTSCSISLITRTGSFELRTVGRAHASQ
jgi:hypothetical protein